MVSFLKKLFTSSNQTNVETPKKNYNTKQRNRTRDSFNMKVDRNLKGIELEKRGRIEEAIELYEMNVEKGFDGNHPYDRLCVIYRKQGKIADEIRVLEEAIGVFGKVSKERSDRDPKLAKFKERLVNATKLL